MAYLKFLTKTNKSIIKKYSYPKAIRRGWKTKKETNLIMCLHGWHCAKATSLGIREWYGARCYVVIPIGRKIFEDKDKDSISDKVCCEQLLFIGFIKAIKTSTHTWGEIVEYYVKKARRITREWKAKKGGR